MRSILFAVLSAAMLLSAQARAADPELTPDAQRMLAYGTLIVMTRACGTVVTAEQATKMQSGLEESSQAQKVLSQSDFTEAMKAAGVQIGQNKAQVCAALTPDYIDSSLAEADATR